VAVPLNSRLAAAEVARMLEHSGAKAVVADGSAVLDDAASGAASGFPALVVDATIAPATAGAVDPRVRNWDHVLASDGDAFQVPRVDDDLADILYTSGTTGHPKGVAVRHVNASLVPPFPPSWSGGVWLHASPMFTFAGLAFTYNPMKLGLQGLYMARFDAGRWLEVVGETKPVAVFLVPAMTHLLIDHPKFAQTDLSSIQICSVGSAPLAPFVIERLQEAMPDAMVSNNYGMTEAGSIFCITPKGEAVKRPGSVGQPAPPGEIRITGPDGSALPAGEEGEVHLRSSVRPREYFNDPEATAQTWVDGWLVTGDLGRLDEDGYLYIVGRNKDVIIRGGNNVHAADVEHAIVSHEAVAEAAVVGAPHPVLGEDVVAFVALHPGVKANPEELREFCLSLLADYKVPRQWHFIEVLPRNATGKVLKAELRRQLEKVG
jgi:long-chain acyl-CoA synthetase